ncbi:hypothetical protein PV773_00170 [Mesorhizobium sp. CC13]|uniref:hypothetical protein n=1 Tax=Mesorhizobium sp. CC13 TaxID=3029194 RepID=UPI0032674C31
MRMMLKVSIPASQGNRTITDGTLPSVMEKALAELKPEAAYFTVQNGLRTGLIFIDVQDISAMPAICEPFFMAFDASIEMTPVMTADDLRAGLRAALQKM